MEERARKTKKCGMCGRRRSVSRFYRNARTKDGLDARCKICCRAYMRAYYAANKERWRESYLRRKARGGQAAAA